VVNGDSQSGHRDPILVVGAGPTGLVLAIELLRRGVPVRLIDRLAHARGWSQAIFIKQRTLEILASLGLVTRFVIAGEWVRRIAFYSGGRQVSGYDFEGVNSPYQNILSIPESASIAILTEELRRLGGEVEYGTEFIRLSEKDDRVSVELRTPERGDITIDAPWVVGTDGYHSAVRDAIRDAYDGRDYEEFWGVFDTRLMNWRRPRDTVCAQLDPPLVAPFPLAPDSWRIYFRTDEPSERVPDAVVAKLRSISPGAALRDPGPPQYFHSHSRLARTFQIGRVLLAGDAAHASNPMEGHGMNAGIHDAHNLGWKLAAVAAGKGTDALLRSYGEERQSVDREIVASGDKTYAWMTDKTGEKLAELYAFLDTASGRALAAMGDTEIGFCYPQSAIIQDARSGPASPRRAGDRIDNIDGLLGPNGYTGLHALVANPGHTILLIAGRADPADLSGIVADVVSVAQPYGCRFLLAVGEHWRGDVMQAVDVVIDKDALCHKLFGGDGPTLCAVRPDGHIGLLCEPPQAAVLQSHLLGMFRASA
jgi:2-polyprenyl-6-methoxyphenol hydroxylase-like FAD-dependent oxidoreductase